MENVSQDRIRLSASEAQTLSEQALGKIGYDAEEARIIADHVVDAALCGYEYSGLPKILNVAEHRQLRQPRRPMRVLRETPVSALFDGGNNNGMVAMYRATQVAIAKAREHGFSAVGVNNSWVSGRSAHYVEMVARADLIGIHSVSSRIHVAAPGSRDPATGTNPIAFAFPTLHEPFVVDLGTAAFMGTDLIFQERRDAVLPEGVAIDAQGRPTRDPAQVHAILPFGGHKGFALALAMQALGVVAGSGLGDDKTYGYLVMAIKPDLLVPLGDFKRDVSAMLARVKATPRQPGVDEIRIPSERAFRERAFALREGIEIDRRIYDVLLALPTGQLPALV
ncbi:MAG: Ldh family oxidoreductase [Betaproteobacteria bacterium]|nr:Ldh family oxidoreductase [Betaproteobacteria bacterium]